MPETEDYRVWRFHIFLEFREKMLYPPTTMESEIDFLGPFLSSSHLPIDRVGERATKNASGDPCRGVFLFMLRVLLTFIDVLLDSVCGWIWIFSGGGTGFFLFSPLSVSFLNLRLGFLRQAKHFVSKKN
jgi:hypothetical protein